MPANLDSDAVVLVRRRLGLSGGTAHTVHLIPVPDQTEVGVANALCGALLFLDDIEIVGPDQGVPCTACLLCRTASMAPPPIGAAAPAGPAPIHRRATPAGYRALGWPVLTQGHQVLLGLDQDVLALMVPAGLADEVATILDAQHRPAPVLAHPYAPEHRVFLAGERYGIELPWPAEVHLITGTVPLPPTATPRGPISWQHLPDDHALCMCREIDVFAAVRTATTP